MPGDTPLTQQGYAELEAEIVALKGKRSQVIDEMRRAAADKDFRENAPLEAAREEHGQLVGRIRELEETLKSATIIDEKQEVAIRASIGDSILLRNVATGEEVRYMIVSPREVDPTKDRISSASPIGKAALGRSRGEIIEVVAPAGKLRYQIEQIER
ncbi:Transcription elongation factor GreA [subsurface metagenome]